MSTAAKPITGNSASTPPTWNHINVKFTSAANECSVALNRVGNIGDGCPSFHKSKSFNQSINQSINQSVNQSINQSINQSTTHAKQSCDSQLILQPWLRHAVVHRRTSRPPTAAAR
jgi:hypothetical protein